MKIRRGEDTVNNEYDPLEKAYRLIKVKAQNGENRTYMFIDKHPNEYELSSEDLHEVTYQLNKDGYRIIRHWVGGYVEIIW